MRIVHLSRRRLLPALLLLLAALAAALFFALKKQSVPQTIYADGAAGCAAYLQKLGWEVEPEPVETLQLRLPDDLAERFADYTALCLLRRPDRLPLHLPPHQLPRRPHGRPGQPPPQRHRRHRRRCDASG